MLRATQDVLAVVDAIKVDWPAIVVGPCAAGRWGQADHLGECCPTVDMRHHFIVLRASRNVLGPPHQARDAPTGFKRCAFFAAKWRGSSVGVGILPCTVVRRHDHNRVGCLRADRVHDPPDVVIELEQRVRVIP